MPARRLRRLAAAGVLVPALLAAVLVPAGAAPAAEPSAPRDDVWGGAGDRLPRSVVRHVEQPRTTLSTPRQDTTGPQPQAYLTSAPVSDIVVEYVERGATWTPQAKAAFDAAVEVWERTVESAVPIVVEATATTFGDPTVLGGAGPARFSRDDAGTAALQDDVFEPIALHNARRRTDTLPGVPDILASFNPGRAGLYFGTDGNPPADRVDFKTIVLHEIGHGLGLVGTAQVDGSGRASLGDASVNGGEVRSPVSYDLFAYGSDATRRGDGGTRVVDLPDGSPELAAALTGGQLYWSGQLARNAARGTVPLYAPGEWLAGSSYGHLDEDTYVGEHPNALMTPFLQNGESLARPGQVAMGMLADMGWAVPALEGSRYTAVGPVRVLDTRGDEKGEPVGVRTGPVTAEGFIDLPVAGRSGVPAGATAVVLNVTGVAPTSATDVRVYPTPVVEGPLPRTSNLNLVRGQNRANLVTVPLGNGGRVRLRNAAGALHLVADLAGYYLPSAASTFTPADPTRVLDTRGDAEGREIGSRIGTLGAGETIDLSVVRNGPVPPDAAAVVMTVTAVGPTASTDVRVYPAPQGSEVPRVSNVNAGPGAVVPNVVIVPLGPDGTVRFRNQSGAVHLLADVAGWYDDSGSGALFRPVGPTRVLDTRVRTGIPPDAPTRVGPGGTVTLRVGGLAQVPSVASAAVLNVTGVAASAHTDVRLYPATALGVPTVSNLNLRPGETAADLAVVKLGGGQVVLRNQAGEVALVADVFGWFGPPA